MATTQSPRLPLPRPPPPLSSSSPSSSSSSFSSQPPPALPVASSEGRLTWPLVLDGGGGRSHGHAQESADANTSAISWPIPWNQHTPSAQNCPPAVRPQSSFDPPRTDRAPFTSRAGSSRAPFEAASSGESEKEEGNALREGWAPLPQPVLRSSLPVDTGSSSVGQFLLRPERADHLLNSHNHRHFYRHQHKHPQQKPVLASPMSSPMPVAATPTTNSNPTGLSSESRKRLSLHHLSISTSSVRKPMSNDSTIHSRTPVLAASSSQSADTAIHPRQLPADLVHIVDMDTHHRMIIHAQLMHKIQQHQQQLLQRQLLQAQQKQLLMLKMEQDQARVFRQLVQLVIRMLYQLSAPFQLFHSHAAGPYVRAIATGMVASTNQPSSASRISPSQTPPTSRSPKASSVFPSTPSPFGLTSSPPASPAASAPVDGSRSLGSGLPTSPQCHGPQVLELDQLLQRDRVELSRLKALTLFMCTLPARHLMNTSVATARGAGPTSAQIKGAPTTTLPVSTQVQPGEASGQHQRSIRPVSQSQSQPTHAHHVFHSLLIVSRLVGAALHSKKSLPLELMSPSALFLAGCILSEIQLCDSQTSAATWAGLADSSPQTSDAPATRETQQQNGWSSRTVVNVKMAALSLLSYETRVGVDEYLQWLQTIKEFS